MNIDLRPLNLTATTPEAKIAQIQSYLVQFVSQLQYALYSIEEQEKEYIERIEKKQKEITPEKEAENTFNSIKSLIIKSADIVDAYSEEITRELSGLYVAQSDFGTYSEQTSRLIEENSKYTQDVFLNVQEISSSLSEVENMVLETNAYIKSGELDTDEEGRPVIGIEVGQTNNGVFSRYARFTSERLSFFNSNGIEIAYVSGQKLYITSAEITGSLTLGKYEIDTSDGLIFRWVGD